MRAISACLLLLCACGKPAAPAAFARPPAPVTVAPVGTEDVPRYIDEIGKAVAREVVTIRSQVSGRITELLFKDGADVKLKEHLFTIDPRPYQAQLDAADAGFVQATAAVALAQSEFDRVTKLDDARAVSKQEVQAKSSALDVAKARLDQSQAAVTAAKLNVEYCTIRSPIAGRAGRRLIDQGNIIDANGPALLVVQQVDPIYAEFSVPEQRLADVRRSMAAGTVKVELRSPEQPDKPVAAELTFLDGAVRGGTGTVTLRATAANGDRFFWPGQFVRVRIILDTIKGAVLLPASASQLSGQGPFVYVIKEDSTAELRPVVLGQRHGERVVVEKGLQPGERIVLEGHMGVMPGAKVNVVAKP